MVRLIFLLAVLTSILCSKGNKPVFTKVTFMYNIKRSELGGQFQRTYQSYLQYFDKLLTTESNLIVFGDNELRERVFKRRTQANTVFVEKKLQSFKNYWFQPYVRKIRQKRLQDPSFPFKHYPQFGLEYYNLLMFGKLYVLTEALQYDKFNSDFFIWLDGGYMHVFGTRLASPQNVLKRIYEFIQPQWLFIFYNDRNMFLGYSEGSQKYVKGGVDTSQAILAGCFGGYIQAVRDIKNTYENLLRLVLENGDMNSDESVFSIFLKKFPYLVSNHFEVGILDMYEKLYYNEVINRKPEHPRFFSNSYKQIIKTAVSTKQDKVMVENREPSQIRKETRVEIKNNEEENETETLQQYLDLMKDKNSLYRQVFYRQLTYLLFMIIFYVIILVRKPKEKKNKYGNIPNFQTEQKIKIQKI